VSEGKFTRSSTPTMRAEATRLSFMIEAGESGFLAVHRIKFHCFSTSAGSPRAF
jgi:hypothetical protein